MLTPETLWIELAENMERIARSEHRRIALRCDTLAFFDLMLVLEQPMPQHLRGTREKIEAETAEFTIDLSEENDVEEQRYFRFLNSFDSFISEDIMLLLTHRIDVELYRAYTQHTNYVKYLNHDRRLVEVLSANLKASKACQADLIRNRGVKIGKGTFLPMPYRKVLQLIA